MVNKLTLHPTTEDDVIAVDDFEYKMMGEVPGVVLEDDDDEEDDEEFITLHTFAETDNLSMKIISFPEMKNKIESNLCCKMCMKNRHKGGVLLYQKKYKLAMVLTFVCKYGHEFHICPDKINDLKSDSSKISR